MSKQTLATLLAGAFFLSQTALPYAAEANIWAERRGRSDAPQFAALPQGLTPNSKFDPETLFKSVPQLQKAAQSQNEKFLPSGKTLSTIPNQDLLSAVPLNAGKVVDLKLPQKGAPKGLVALIQDVHLNEEAQQNIGEVIQSLGEAYNKDRNKKLAVGIEGAFGDFDFSRFNAYPDKPFLKTLAEWALKEGKIAAPVLVGLSHLEQAPYLYGIDHPAHYQANVEAVQSTAGLKEDLKTETQKSKAVLLEEKRKTFSSRLISFDDRRTAYHEGDLGLGAYLGRLKEEADALQMKATGEEAALALPIQSFLAAYELEKNLNFSRVERERRSLIEALTKKAPKKDLETLAAYGLAVKAGKISAGEFYSRFRTLAEENGTSLTSRPAFDDYVRYVLLVEGIQADDLFASVETLEQDVASALAQTAEEKTLLRQSEFLSLQEKLIAFALIPSEWERYQSLKRDPALVSPDLRLFEKFYVEADYRSEAMVKNLIQPATQQGVVAALTGGYHSNHMASLLTKQGLAVATIRPLISNVGDGSGTEYLSVFNQEKTPLDRLFAGEKLFLAIAAQSAFSEKNPSSDSLTNRLSTIALARLALLENEAGIDGLGTVRSTQEGLLTIKQGGQTLFASYGPIPNGFEAVGEPIQGPLDDALILLAPVGAPLQLKTTKEAGEFIFTYILPLKFFVSESVLEWFIRVPFAAVWEFSSTFFPTFLDQHGQMEDEVRAQRINGIELIHRGTIIGGLIGLAALMALQIVFDLQTILSAGQSLEAFLSTIQYIAPASFMGASLGNIGTHAWWNHTYPEFALMVDDPESYWTEKPLFDAMTQPIILGPSISVLISPGVRKDADLTIGKRRLRDEDGEKEFLRIYVSKDILNQILPGSFGMKAGVDTYGPFLDIQIPQDEQLVTDGFTDITFGRGPTNIIQLTAQDFSGIHGKIRVNVNGTIEIHDIGSEDTGTTNGTNIRIMNPNKVWGRGNKLNIDVFERDNPQKEVRLGQWKHGETSREPINLTAQPDEDKTLRNVAQEDNQQTRMPNVVRRSLDESRVQNQTVPEATEGAVPGWDSFPEAELAIEALLGGRSDELELKLGETWIIGGQDFPIVKMFLNENGDAVIEPANETMAEALNFPNGQSHLLTKGDRIGLDRTSLPKGAREDHKITLPEGMATVSRQFSSIVFTENGQFSLISKGSSSSIKVMKIKSAQKAPRNVGFETIPDSVASKKNTLDTVDLAPGALQESKPVKEEPKQKTTKKAGVVPQREVSEYRALGPNNLLLEKQRTAPIPITEDRGLMVKVDGKPVVKVEKDSEGNYRIESSGEGPFSLANPPIYIGLGQKMSFGRNPQAGDYQVRVVDNVGFVSSSHFTLDLTEQGEIIVADLDSTNGTQVLVSGDPLSEQEAQIFLDNGLERGVRSVGRITPFVKNGNGVIGQRNFKGVEGFQSAPRRSVFVFSLGENIPVGFSATLATQEDEFLTGIGFELLLEEGNVAIPFAHEYQMKGEIVSIENVNQTDESTIEVTLSWNNGATEKFIVDLKKRVVRLDSESIESDTLASIRLSDSISAEVQEKEQPVQEKKEVVKEETPSISEKPSESFRKRLNETFRNIDPTKFSQRTVGDTVAAQAIGSSYLVNPGYPVENEDRAIANKEISLGSVTDGMGGQAHGSEASGLVSGTVLGNITGVIEQNKLVTEGDVEFYLKHVINRAHAASLETGVHNGEPGATTFAGFLGFTSGNQKKAALGSVGDSYVILVRDGKVYFPVLPGGMAGQRVRQNLKDQGSNFKEVWPELAAEIELAESETGSFELPEFLGMSHFYKPDDERGFNIIDVQEGDLLLAVSDGVTDNYLGKNFDEADKTPLLKFTDEKPQKKGWGFSRKKKSEGPNGVSQLEKVIQAALKKGQGAEGVANAIGESSLELGRMGLIYNLIFDALDRKLGAVALAETLVDNKLVLAKASTVTEIIVNAMGPGGTAGDHEDSEKIIDELVKLGFIPGVSEKNGSWGSFKADDVSVAAIQVDENFGSALKVSPDQGKTRFTPATFFVSFSHAPKRYSTTQKADAYLRDSTAFVERGYLGEVVIPVEYQDEQDDARRLDVKLESNRTSGEQGINLYFDGAYKGTYTNPGVYAIGLMASSGEGGILSSPGQYHQLGIARIDGEEGSPSQFLTEKNVPNILLALDLRDLSRPRVIKYLSIQGAHGEDWAPLGLKTKTFAEAKSEILRLDGVLVNTASIPAAIRSNSLTGTLESTLTLGRFLSKIFLIGFVLPEAWVDILTKIFLAPIVEIPASLRSDFVDRHGNLSALDRQALQNLQGRMGRGAIIGVVLSLLAVPLAYAFGDLSALSSFAQAGSILAGSAVGFALGNASPHAFFNMKGVINGLSNPYSPLQRQILEQAASGELDLENLEASLPGIRNLGLEGVRDRRLNQNGFENPIPLSDTTNQTPEEKADTITLWAHFEENLSKAVSYGEKAADTEVQGETNSALRFMNPSATSEDLGLEIDALANEVGANGQAVLFIPTGMDISEEVAQKAANLGIQLETYTSGQAFDAAFFDSLGWAGSLAGLKVFVDQNAQGAYGQALAESLRGLEDFMSQRDLTVQIYLTALTEALSVAVPISASQMLNMLMMKERLIAIQA